MRAHEGQPDDEKSSPLPPGQGRVLIVEDDPVVRRLIATVLTDAGHSCEEAADAEVASGRMADASFDVVICDLQLPGASGLDLVRRVRERDSCVAILMVTASDDPRIAAGALDAGADGYVTKPFRPNDLVIGVLNVVRQRRSSALEPDARDRTDPLTGLPDRRRARALLEDALERSEAAGTDVAVLVVNLDRFALINAALGHAAGDALLQAAAARLRATLRPGGIVARLSGDEFAAICEAAGGEAIARDLADRILAALRTPFAVDGLDHTVSASIGIAVAEAGVGRADALMRDAGIALKQAKKAGGDVERVFELGMREPWLRRLSAEAELRQALVDEQFRLFYQPIVALHDGGLTGLEALLRWEHPEHGIVAPDRFIPVAEETGLIVDLGAWVIAEACRQLGEWAERLIGIAIPQVSVNVSARQFAEPAFTDTVMRTLGRTGIEPDQLAFEITEGLLVSSAESLAALQAAHDLGIRLILDDFGTGYSSLGYLKRFPIQGLKIDRLFITGMTEDEADLALVRGIVAMAASLAMPVVAEGVETEEQVAALRSLDCHLAQGFLFDRPLPALAATKLLREEHSWHDTVAAHGSAAPRTATRDSSRRTSTVTAHAGVADESTSGLLKPAEAAAALGVSLSTLRRWSDSRRLPIVKTRGGHRRFRVEDIQRFKQATDRDVPAVQPVLPPTRALPALAKLLSGRSDVLLTTTLRHLYAGASAGWFASEEARSALANWMQCLTAAGRQGDYDGALSATRSLMRRAQIHGATLLERHRFIDSFGEAGVRLLAQGGSDREELIATRRLFASLAQAMLDS